MSRSRLDSGTEDKLQRVDMRATHEKYQLRNRPIPSSNDWCLSQRRARKAIQEFEKQSRRLINAESRVYVPSTCISFDKWSSTSARCIESSSSNRPPLPADQTVTTNLFTQQPQLTLMKSKSLARLMVSEGYPRSSLSFLQRLFSMLTVFRLQY